MKLGVLVKTVPDTETKIKLSSDQKNIETQGIKYIMNTYDEFAVEEALKIREKFPDGTTVTVIGMGPDLAIETLRTALAMGADDAIHITDPALHASDSVTTARVLAKVIEPMGFDLIFCGKQGIDFDAAQTGGALAELMGFSQAMVAVGLEMGSAEGKLTIKRRIEGGDEVVEVSLPAIISCEKGLNEPRYASLPGIMKAKKKEIKTFTLSEIGLSAEEVGEAGSATRIVKYMPLPGRPECRMLSGESAEMAKELVRALREDSKVV